MLLHVMTTMRNNVFIKINNFTM